MHGSCQYTSFYYKSGHECRDKIAFYSDENMLLLFICYFTGEGPTDLVWSSFWVPWKERDKYVERHRATRRTDRERKRVPERGNVKVRREVCSWSLHKVVKLNYVTKLSRRVGKKYPQSCLVALVFFTKLYRKLACPQFLSGDLKNRPLESALTWHNF